jgi:broad specificity phosphatase PhoE
MGRRATMMRGAAVLGAGLLMPILPVPARAQQQSAAADSAEAYYRLGRELLARGEARIRSPWGLLDAVTLWEDILRLFGRDGASRARDSFRRALSFDPTHAGAAIELAQLALASGEADALREAERALAGAASVAEPPADVWLWQARVATALGERGAGALARRYREAGGKAALALLAEARALFAAGGDSVGAARYLAGLDSLDAESAAAYFQDLGPLVRETEAAEWEAARDPAAQAAWLRRFWARRAAEAGVPMGERVAEHYRRLLVATERYRRTSRRNASLTDIRAVNHGLRDFGLDDRGVVYILHGRPDTVVATVAADVMPNESWLYRLPEGELVLHFVALRRAGEYVLVDDPLKAYEGSLAPRCTALGCLGPEGAIALLEDRETLDPRYALLANRVRLRQVGSPRMDADVEETRHHLSAEMLRFATTALAGDTYVPDLGEHLPFYYDTYGFRAPDGGTDLVVALAVPGEELRPEAAPAGVVYPLELDVLVLDTLTGAMYRADTLRTFHAPAPLGNEENLRAIVQLGGLPAGSYVHRVVLRSRGSEPAGAMYGGPIEVHDFTGDTLMISDVVLAEAEGSGWSRGGTPLGLVPPRQFRRGETVSLFYELYNVPAGATYRTVIRAEPLQGSGLWAKLKRLFGGESAPLALSFDAVVQATESGTAQVIRQLDLGSLLPGAYRLTVSASVGDRTVRRTTTFAIRDE